MIPVPEDEPIEALIECVAQKLGAEMHHTQHDSPAVPRRVLVIDDDPDFSSTMREMLEQAGCDVAVALGGAEALAWADQSTCAPDLVLLDYSMPDWTGLDLAPPLRERWPDVEIVLLTAYDEPWLCDEAFREKIDEYLCKPVRAADVLRLLEEV